MPEVAINKKLNLVIPIETDTGKIWIHSTPISRAIFESNWLLLTRTLSYLYSNTIGPAMAPRVAALGLRDTAKELDETKDVSNDFIIEMYRLTSVLMPNPGGAPGWQTIPFSEVKARKLIDEEQLAEVENALVYFIVASAVHPTHELGSVFTG